MISVHEALALVLRAAPRLEAEPVGLAEALGRVLAEPIRAARDVPPFRNAAMDGFAVRAADVATAAPAAPVRLQVLEVVGAGTPPRREVRPGAATQIMTGSPVPEGADAVVRVEDTEPDGGHVRILAAAAAGANVRERGEDVKAGETVLTPGHTLRPADLGVLASLGVTRAAVSRRPEVALLATGDELVEAGEPLGPGQIVNSNAYALAAALKETGAVVRPLGIVRDTPEALRAAFGAALDADAVLSTGGVSMGLFDLVRRTLAELGVVERFWKVAQRPGKPLAFGVRGRVPVFGLPGNPVSALVCFYVYVRPLLRAMQGCERLHLPTVTATVAADIRTAPGMTEFVRCTLEGTGDGYSARLTGSQSSGVLRSLSLGHGLLVAPPEVATVPRGSRARVIRLVEEGAADAPV